MKIFIIIISFILGITVGYNYGALRNIWDWDSGSLEELNRTMAQDKSDRLALIILTQQRTYEISRIDPKYKLQLQLLEKVTQ
jgi:hypothetical protein